jgi:DNA-binding winged helix-turn-helix (wHTH) protein/tetratricopeptide (TPR) repeat protein
MPTDQELKKGFTIGDWQVLPAKGVLRREDVEERPEPMVFEVLMALARRDGDLVTRDELIDEIWDGRPIGDEPINRCLSQLRGHLGDRQRPYRYIETLTRRGYRLNEPVQLLEPAAVNDNSTVAASTAGNRRWLFFAGIGVAIVLALVFRGFVAPPAPMGVGDVRSIGVLPCENLSRDPDDRYLVAGFQNELVRTLQNIPDLAVKRGRVAYPGLEVGEIAAALRVDAILFCAVQRQVDTLKISYHIAESIGGTNISAGSFTGKLEAIFGLQERLAKLVRDGLLGESPQQLISASRPESAEAYDRYMRGMYALERRTVASNLEDAIDLFKQTINLDPQFGPAYLSLATAYALLHDYRDAELEEMHRQAIETVERGIAVDDSIRDAANAIFGFVYHKQRRWSEAEQAYIRAINAQVVDSNAFNWYARMLAGVGRREDALRQALNARELDPSSAMINSLIAVIYTWLNDAEKAEEFYERANQLGASGTNHLLGNALILIRDGRFGEAMELTRESATIAGDSSGWVDAVFAAMSDASQRSNALLEIDTASSEGRLDPRVDLTLRTVLGDLDGAMAVAESLAGPDNYFEMDVLFLPELRPLREHPGFFPLMEQLGVKQYWDEKGCVWLDDSISCPH